VLYNSSVFQTGFYSLQIWKLFELIDAVTITGISLYLIPIK